ncbi:alpha-amylase family glycosyl hydrolase [Vulcaniibacterium tengchongense]|uniref:Maltose alpha-D-glucosyltransferase/alpha-amylase n=1 Tax=Vulcaniibacterium tengchongense TaxID=1273429 RepID=A0A3N4V1U7_9GAMM|nr:alpha-amylase family glycosyl hydrolase [Vulcaniibacterium tengchongense]RPE76906.1 maltose alpha-D-glucosyltransferase/alpha-amylase [Vulcaniibacterium tengchongense]
MWYHDTAIYQIDPSLFADGDGDGCGDLRGITDRLEYVRSLGFSTIWLLPFYRSPFRDGGYDVSDHLSVDPRFGDIADFAALVERAEALGLRVLVELVMQHTSDRHPWFQRARSDRHSPYRDYYVWADEPVDDGLKPIFPGVEDSIWTWDEAAGQYYRHLFYRHEPDLNLANPAVREEMYRTMAYWLRLGVAGFRVDAVPYMIERARQADPRDDGLWLLDDLHAYAWQRAPGAVLLGEADVQVDQYRAYLGDEDRLSHVLDFWVNNHIFLALARRRARPLYEALERNRPPPPRSRRAVWLRNHDELDLEQLSPEDREEVMRQFAPDPDMRIYGRGIRRRVAPMLDGDPARVAMAHALLFSLPGIPVLRYGDEIGMGEDLSRPERNAVRIPMQWHDGKNGGFSTAPEDRLVVRPVAEGPFGYRRTNVEAQQWRPGSLWARTRDLARTRAALREMRGDGRPAKFECASVFGLRYDDPVGGDSLVALVNLAPEPVEFELREDDLDALVDVVADAGYDGAPPPPRIRLNGYGYRWLRRRRGSY